MIAKVDQRSWEQALLSSFGIDDKAKSRIHLNLCVVIRATYFDLKTFDYDCVTLHKWDLNKK